MGTETTFIEGFCLNETDAAYLVAEEPLAYCKEVTWWPKTQVVDCQWDGKFKGEITLEVTEWIAKQKGII